MESTGVMEGLANGCVFLNPKFFEAEQFVLLRDGKPTTRKVATFYPYLTVEANMSLRCLINLKMTSQVPYLEDFIGPPHVFTINTHSRSDIDDVMHRTSSLNFRPFVPHEFSTTGFLERLNFYIELQNFSSEKASSWPSEHLLRKRVGDADESCVDACKRQHLTCEPSFFHFINNKDSFTRLDEDLLIIFTVHAHHFFFTFSA